MLGPNSVSVVYRVVGGRMPQCALSPWTRDSQVVGVKLGCLECHFTKAPDYRHTMSIPGSRKALASIRGSMVSVQAGAGRAGNQCNVKLVWLLKAY